jgi:hypothetical protein
MKILMTFIILILSIFTINPDISMLGLKIHDSQKVLENIKVKLIYKDSIKTKYRTDNGNNFSVIIKNGQIVFMENEWLFLKNGKTPLITKFKFGETSVKEIKKVFGTNGFVYKKRLFIKTESDMVQYYYFEIDSPNNEILALETKVWLDNPKLTWYNIEEYLILDDIIIADKEYLDEIWGSDKEYFDVIKKIKI